MARWKLTAPHYLTVPGTRWEHKEIDRTTGRQKTVPFPVPRYLHPDDPADWTKRLNKDEGEVIVTDGNNADPTDIPFIGPPTPDMAPIDAEAQAISDSFRSRWSHPIEDLPSRGGYSEVLLEGLQKQIAEVQVGIKGAASIPGVDPKAFNELQESVKGLLEQNSALLQHLIGKPTETRRI